MMPVSVMPSDPVPITHADDSEGRADQRCLTVLSEHGSPSYELIAVHEPDLCLATVVVVPDDVILAVAVHVTHADDSEGRADQRCLTVLSEHGSPSYELIA